MRIFRYTTSVLEEIFAQLICILNSLKKIFAFPSNNKIYFDKVDFSYFFLDTHVFHMLHKISKRHILVLKYIFPIMHINCVSKTSSLRSIKKQKLVHTGLYLCGDFFFCFNVSTFLDRFWLKIASDR
jgi:hypothetical protein